MVLYHLAGPLMSADYSLLWPSYLRVITQQERCNLNSSQFPAPQKREAFTFSSPTGCLSGLIYVSIGFWGQEIIHETSILLPTFQIMMPFLSHLSSPSGSTCQLGDDGRGHSILAFKGATHTTCLGWSGASLPSDLPTSQVLATAIAFLLLNSVFRTWGKTSHDFVNQIHPWKELR